MKRRPVASQPVDLYRWRDAILSEHGPANAHARIVLLAIGQHMKADGTGAWPAQTFIARRAHVSERTVRGHLEIAERNGWIERTRVRRESGRNWYFTEYSACVPEDVYSALPDRPWEADPEWRREPAANAGTHTNDRQHLPPVNEVNASTGKSAHEYRQMTTRVPANDCTDDRQHLPTNSPSETLPRTLSQEGALTRTAVPAIENKTRGGSQPERIAKPSDSANQDVLREENWKAIRKLRAAGYSDAAIVKQLSQRHITLDDIREAHRV